MMPGTSVMMLCNPVSGGLYDKLGIRNLSLFGFAMVVIGTVPMLWFNPSTSLFVVGLCYTLRMVGISFTMMTTFIASINASEPKLTAYANAASSTVRQIGGSLGTALAMLVVTLGSAASGFGAGKAVRSAAQETGYHWAFILMLVFALVGFVASFFLPSADRERA